MPPALRYLTRCRPQQRLPPNLIVIEVAYFYAFFKACAMSGILTELGGRKMARWFARGRNSLPHRGISPSLLFLCLLQSDGSNGLRHHSL